MRKKLLFGEVLLCLLLSTSSIAQNIDVTGKVTEEDGTPVVGAVIAVKGGKKATVTDGQGNFILNVPKGTTVVVSYVGYTTKEYTVNEPTLNVSLSKQAKNMEEIVVTALGIKKEKKALGYAISTVGGDELTQARSVNVANALEGKVAGLDITTTATGPGGSTRITLRGNASLNQATQPLIVVDGVPFSNINLGSVGEWGGSDQGDGISSLNPDEIESITVLKGGTAAALYGSRASYGAILVTTKGGSKSGRGPTVELGSNFVAEDLLNKRIKDYQYVYGTGDKGTGLVGVKPTSADPNLNQTNSFGAKLDGSPVIQFDGVARPYVAQRDNLKKFYKTGTTFTNSIALSGGSEKMAYRFSFSDLNVKGIVPHNTLMRDNAAINLNANISKRFTALVNAKYMRERNNNRPRVSDSPGSANYTLWTLPTSLDVLTLKTSKYDSNGFEKVWSNNQYVQNPYFATEDFKEADTKERYLGAIEPKFDITSWLYIKGRAGFDKINRRENDITPTGTGYQVGGGYNTNLYDFRETDLDLMLGLNKNITSDININALVGGSEMKQVIITNSYGGNPFNIPFFYDISNISTPNRYTNYGYSEKRINSLYGFADLSFKNFLYLNFSGRNDWFSTLAPGRNSLFYPSVGLSFVLSDAIRLPSSINFAKIRASWAQTGSDTDPYQLALTYSLTGATQGAPLAQINQSTVPNALLQPLVVTSSEIGLEGRLLNNRLGIDFAVYTRKTTKDIVQASVSPSSGYTAAIFNVGEVTNKGVELLISYRVGNSPSFTWEPSFNFGYNKSNVVNIYGTLDKYFVEEPRPRVSGIYQVVGKPFAQILGNGFLRKPNTNEVIFNAQGLQETKGLKSFGSGISPWTMGFTNSFRYKSFGISFLVDAKFGGFIYSGTNALAYRYGLHKNTLPGRETGVIGKGVVVTSGTVTYDIQGNIVNDTRKFGPNTVVVDAETYYTNLYSFAEPFVFSSDFIKLRQLIIDYTVPPKVFSGSPFKAIIVSLVGRNLWTIMKHTPIVDPESGYSASNAQGQEFAGLPATRTMGINLNLKF
jgi:TonB-linked SusC/RagA family outer membrane protein